MIGSKTLAYHRPWWIQILAVALAAIVFIEIFGLFGTKILGPAIGWSAEVHEYWAVSQADTWEGRFVRWDSGYYLDIAQCGYTVDGPDRAFFQLCPLLSAATSKLTGISLLWSGLSISILSLIAAVMIYYQWVQIDHIPEIFSKTNSKIGIVTRV
jgi:hypothetical protein